jgi:hypothetical protein
VTDQNEATFGPTHRRQCARKRLSAAQACCSSNECIPPAL